MPAQGVGMVSVGLFVCRVNGNKYQGPLMLDGVF